MKLEKKKISILISLSLSTAFAYAEEYYMDEVVVSATKNEQQARDISSSVDLISADDVKDGLKQDLKQVLAGTAGVSVSGTGRFGANGITIRGLGEDRVKTVIDGVELPQRYDQKIGDDNTIQKENNAFETDTLQAVEINKGPVSSLYGSDALAGAVIIRTKNPSDILKTSENETQLGVSTGYASADNSYKTTVQAANRYGKLETMAIYTRRDGHETQTHGSGADVLGRERGKADPISYQSDNILAKAKYQLTDNQQVGLTVEHFQRDKDLDMLSNEGHSMGTMLTYSNTSSQDEESRTRYGFDYSWQANQALFDNLKWQVSYSDSQTKYNTFDTVTRPTGVENRRRYREGQNEIWQTDFQFTKDIERENAFHQLVYGASYLQDAFSLNYLDYNLTAGTVTPGTVETPNATSQKWGVFLQDQIFLINDALVLNAGLRYDSFLAKPESSTYPNAENDAFTGRLGALYHWTDNHSTYAQISQGFKAPTLTDLYYHYGRFAIFQPNPNLKAEESLSYELGYRFNAKSTKLSLVGFYNDYQNFIDTVSLGTDAETGLEVSTRTNIHRAEIYGAEFQLGWDISALLAIAPGFSTDFTLAYAQGQNKQTGAAIDSVAPLSSTINFAYNAPSSLYGGKLSFTAVAGKSGSDWENETNLKAPGYLKIDLTAYYSPYNDFMIRAGLFNALDTKYWDYLDLSGRTVGSSGAVGIDRRSQPGRNWGIDFSYNF